MQRPVVAIAILIVSLLSLWFGLSVGSVKLTHAEVWQALIGQGSEVHRQIVHELRAPPALNAENDGSRIALCAPAGDAAAHMRR